MKYRLPMLLDGASQNEQSEAAEPPSTRLSELFRQDIRSGARALFLRIPTEFYPVDEDREERFRKIAAEYAEAARKAIAEENAECPIAGVIAPVTADDEDVALVRKTFYRTLMSFVRAPMIRSTGVPLYQAFRNVEAVEEAYRRSEKSMNDDAVLSALLDRISF